MPSAFFPQLSRCVPKSEARGEFPKPKPKRPKTSGHGDNGQYQEFFGRLNAKRAEVERRMGEPGKPLSIGSFAASAAPADRRHVPGVAPNHGAPSKPDITVFVDPAHAPGAAPNERAPPKSDITVYEIFDDSPEKMDTEGFEDSAGRKCKGEDSATQKCKSEDSASPKCKKGLGLADDDDNCFAAEDSTDDTDELEEQRLNAPSPELPSPGATLPPSPGTARALADVVSYKSKAGIGGFRVPVGPMAVMLDGQPLDLGAAAGGGGGYSDGSADEDLEHELENRRKASARSKARTKEKWKHDSLMANYKGQRGGHVRAEGDDRLEQRGTIMAARAEKKEVRALDSSCFTIQLTHLPHFTGETYVCRW